MAFSNYPLGVDGSHPYFDEPTDPPECRKCRRDVDPDWAYCPWCGEPAREEWPGDVSRPLGGGRR